MFYFLIDWSVRRIEIRNAPYKHLLIIIIVVVVVVVVVVIIIIIIIINPLMPTRRFYSSKGEPLGTKGLKKLSPLTL